MYFVLLFLHFRISKILSHPKMLYISREWLSVHLNDEQLDQVFQDAVVNPTEPNRLLDNITDILVSASHQLDDLIINVFR